MLLQSTQKLPYPYSFKNTNKNIEIINFFIQMNEVREDDYQTCCSSWNWGFLWMLQGNVFRRLQLKCKTYTSNWLLDPNCFDEHSQYQIWADVACGVLQGENSIIKKHSLCPSNRTDPRMNVWTPLPRIDKYGCRECEKRLSDVWKTFFNYAIPWRIYLQRQRILSPH